MAYHIYISTGIYVVQYELIQKLVFLTEHNEENNAGVTHYYYISREVYYFNPLMPFFKKFIAKL